MEICMSPEERQLLADLFDRIRKASGQTRDRDAEAYIADAVRTQPYAPYLLAQTVIVQDQALRAANDKLTQLEAQVQELEASAARQNQSGGFLGGLGGLFGGGTQAAPSPPRPTSGPWGGAPQGGGFQGGAPQGGGFPGGPPPAPGWGGGGGAWGGPPPVPQQGGGGGFLKGALGAAAGVAGGVLLADSIRGLFHGGNNPLGIGTGFGSGLGGSGSGNAGGDTVVNNYYGNDSGRDDGGYAPSDNNDVSDADYASDSDYASNNDNDDGGYA
jgi:hypothetical protein